MRTTWINNVKALPIESEEKFTKGPWITGDKVKFGDGETAGNNEIWTHRNKFLVPFRLAECCENDLHWAGGTVEANAQRIVATVNACERISTKALENGAINDMYEALKSIEELTMFCGEGTVEIKSTHKSGGSITFGPNVINSIIDASKKVETALKKARGEV